MDEIQKNITSLSWWFGVVFVGVIVSLLAAYIKPKMDSWLAKYSDVRRNKNIAESQKWDSDVHEIKTKELKRFVVLSTLTYLKGRAIFSMLLGVAFFFIANFFTYAVKIMELITREKPETVIASIPFLQTKAFSIFILTIYLFGVLSFLLGVLFSNQADIIYRKISQSEEVQ